MVGTSDNESEAPLVHRAILYCAAVVAWLIMASYFWLSDRESRLWLVVVVVLPPLFFGVMSYVPGFKNSAGRGAKRFGAFWAAMAAVLIFAAD